MSRKATVTGKPQAQRDKFIEAARELGCDENEEAFKDALKRVAKAPAPKDRD